MNAEEKETTLACVRLELDAFRRDLADRPPARAHDGKLMAPTGDIREQWANRLHNALMAVVEIKPA